MNKMVQANIKTCCPILILKLRKLSSKWFDTFFYKKTHKEPRFFDRFSVLSEGAKEWSSQKKTPLPMNDISEKVLDDQNKHFMV